MKFITVTLFPDEKKLLAEKLLAEALNKSGMRPPESNMTLRQEDAKKPKGWQVSIVPANTIIALKNEANGRLDFPPVYIIRVNPRINNIMLKSVLNEALSHAGFHTLPLRDPNIRQLCVAGDPSSRLAAMAKPQAADISVGESSEKLFDTPDAAFLFQKFKDAVATERRKLAKPENMAVDVLTMMFHQCGFVPENGNMWSIGIAERDKSGVYRIMVNGSAELLTALEKTLYHFESGSFHVIPFRERTGMNPKEILVRGNPVPILAGRTRIGDNGLIDIRAHDMQHLIEVFRSEAEAITQKPARVIVPQSDIEKKARSAIRWALNPDDHHPGSVTLMMFPGNEVNISLPEGTKAESRAALIRALTLMRFDILPRIETEDSIGPISLPKSQLKRLGDLTMEAEGASFPDATGVRRLREDYMGFLPKPAQPHSEMPTTSVNAPLRISWDDPAKRNPTSSNKR